MNCNEHDPVTEHEFRNEKEIETLRNEVTLLEIENSELIKRNENLEWRIEMMKPHFGQSDAAMNKLAGCNSFPNSDVVHNQKVLDGLKTVESLEVQAKNAGYDTPYEYLAAKNGYLVGNKPKRISPISYENGFEDGYEKAKKEHIKLADKYRDALHIITHMGISGMSWQYDYEKCVNIAKEALEI